MKIYNAGIRNVYFCLAYIACLSFSKPIYKNYPRIYDLPLVFKNNQATFGYLYNPQTIHKFLNVYPKRPKLFSGLFLDIKRKKKIIFKKYDRRFSQGDLKKFSNIQLFSIYNDFFTLLRRLFYFNQVIWTLDIGGSIFLKRKLKNLSLAEISLITQPEELNYLQEEENEFLKL